MTGFNDPKDVPVETQKGTTKSYVFHKFDAVGGREISAKYPLTALPKVGDYAVNEETMLKLMAYVGVRTTPDGPPLMLSNRTLVNNHVPDWETLVKIEAGMLEYNCSFFGNGKSFDFFANIANTLKAWVIQTLTELSAASSVQNSRPSQTSKPS